MSEPIVEPQAVDHAAVAAQLQTVVTELRDKNEKRKSRIAELEAAVTGLQSRLSTATDQLKQVTIEMPLRAMATDIAKEPDWFIEQLAKYYTIGQFEGKLSLLTLEGKPVMKDGKPLPWERKALFDLLTAETHPGAKGFRSLLIATRASGASIPANQRRTIQAPAPKPGHHFGLR